MPSMHVAGAAWIALSLRRTRFAWSGISYVAIIYLGSVMLGWHYLTDGIAGVAGAWLCFALTGRMLSKRASASGTTARPGPAAAEPSR
jgi:membrane-associated phospholipid phosphatase